MTIFCNWQRKNTQVKKLWAAAKVPDKVTWWSRVFARHQYISRARACTGQLQSARQPGSSQSSLTSFIFLLRCGSAIYHFFSPELWKMLCNNFLCVICSTFLLGSWHIHSYWCVKVPVSLKRTLNLFIVSEVFGCEVNIRYISDFLLHGLALIMLSLWVITSCDSAVPNSNF